MKKTSVILILLIFVILISCKNKEKHISWLEEIGNNNLDTISALTLSDSCTLHYPLKAYPLFIWDIAHNDSFIYIIGQSDKYPIVKFDKNGRFIKAIAKTGYGPGEVVPSIHLRLSVHGKMLAFADYINANKITLYENDDYKTEKYFPRENIITDIAFLNENRLLVACSGFSKKHLFILDENLKIIDSKYNIPVTASISSLFPSGDWSVQVVNTNIISNLVYPFKIYKSKIDNNKLKLIESYSDINAKHWKSVDSTITMLSFMANKPSNKERQLLKKSVSRLNGVIYKEDYFACHFIYYDEKYADKKQHCIFVMKDGDIFYETIFNPRLPFILIPNGEHFVSFDYSKVNNNIILKLYYWELDIKNLQ